MIQALHNFLADWSDIAPAVNLLLLVFVLGGLVSLSRRLRR